MWREMSVSGKIYWSESNIPVGTGAAVSTSGKQRGSHLAWRHNTSVSVAALTLAWCLFGAVPASAQYYGVYYGFWHRHKHRAAKRVTKEIAKQENKDPFGDIPKGPLQIFVSIDQQKLHLYSDGVHVADTSVATGVPSLPTPLGVFSVIQKQVFHRSNIYSNAPMPFMQRITWSGVALHEGESIGHRASHGCIRMPHDFAVRLYHLTKLGVPVYVANGELKPADFADPHLFVHRDEPPAPAPAAAPAMTNAAPATPPTAASPTALGLRVGADGPALDPALGPALAPTAIADAAKSDPPVSDAPQSAAAPAKPSVEAAAAASLDSKAAPTAAASAPAAAAIAPDVPAPTTAVLDPSVPMPPAEPASLIKTAPSSKAPIAIFVSRKEKKIYVRQDFAPLFQAPITIADPDHPFGTLAFTALDYTGDDHTALRWDVVEFPAEPPKVKRKIEREIRYERYGHGRRRIEVVEPPADPTPLETPAEALARIAIPQEAIDYISALIVPGSTLIISDHGLGDETGDGTNFIVVTR
jgi:lipoprotein-anchoring transpeptidase ErfK/SrfK